MRTPAQYVSGEEPMVGDLVDLNRGAGLLGTVRVVISGPNEGAAPGHSVEAWSTNGPGILVEMDNGAFVFNTADNDVVLIKRDV
jgi:hypothetical protein